VRARRPTPRTSKSGREVDGRTAGRGAFTYQQRLISGTRYGNDSLLIEVSTPGRDGYGTPGVDVIRLVSVVLVGNIVAVLYEQGYEGESSDPDIVDDYPRRAINAIQAWLG
jgi:hypothetical protein